MAQSVSVPNRWREARGERKARDGISFPPFLNGQFRRGVRSSPTLHCSSSLRRFSIRSYSPYKALVQLTRRRNNFGNLSSQFHFLPSQALLSPVDSHSLLFLSSLHNVSSLFVLYSDSVQSFPRSAIQSKLELAQRLSRSS